MVAQSPNEEEKAGPPTPVKVSRSGRVVRRQSFHDEVYEGEQHLRTTKTEQAPHRGTSTTESHAAVRSKPMDSSQQRKILKTEKLKEETLPSTTPKTKELEDLKRTHEAAEDEKDEEVVAPVRMKPVLQPPAPTIRPIIVGANSLTSKSAVVAPPINTAVVPPPDTTSAPSSIPKPGNTAAASNLSAKPTLSMCKSKQTQSTGKPPGIGDTKLVPSIPKTKLLDPKRLEAAIMALPTDPSEEKPPPVKAPRRKPGARECMQMSRRFGANVIPEKQMRILLDYCSRGKVEHLIRMRERLDCHSRYIESQIAGLEMLVKERGETDVVVPPLPESSDGHARSGGVSHRSMSDADDTGVAVGTATNPQQVASKVPSDSQTVTSLSATSKHPTISTPVNPPAPAVTTSARSANATAPIVPPPSQDMPLS